VNPIDYLSDTFIIRNPQDLPSLSLSDHVVRRISEKMDKLQFDDDVFSEAQELGNCQKRVVVQF
jgi:hypothetical protein